MAGHPLFTQAGPAKQLGSSPRAVSFERGQTGLRTSTLGHGNQMDKRLHPKNNDILWILRKTVLKTRGKKSGGFVFW